MNSGELVGLIFRLVTVLIFFCKELQSTFPVFNLLLWKSGRTALHVET